MVWVIVILSLFLILSLMVIYYQHLLLLEERRKAWEYGEWIDPVACVTEELEYENE